MHHKRTFRLATVLAIPFLATGCLESDDSSSSGETGQLSMAVTDAPVDKAKAVVVRFTHIELQPADGDRVTIQYDEPKKIDLLALQGADHEWLFEDEEVPAGDYNWIRLHVEPDEAADGPPVSNFGTTSYILFEDRPDEEYRLAIPSGLQTGLKLVGGLTVPADGEASFTVDFDLRKAITEARGAPWEGMGYYFLRPALRLVDNTEVGHLEGQVDPELVDANNDECAGGDAVYVFDDPDQEPRDLRDDDGDAVTTALVKQTEESAAEGTETWAYRVGFLPAGEYRVAFTCDASLDNPEEANDDVGFQAEGEVTIEAGETARLDL